MSLSGNLADLPLSDLIEMTSVGGKTGHLVVYDEEQAVIGEVAFRDGLIVAARCGDLRAEKAFYALLTVKTGTFVFDPTGVIDDESCHLPTESLLMEGMRRLDELQKLRTELPAPAIVRFLGGAEAEDSVEQRILGYLGPGARRVGDIVDGILVGGDADEYDALKALKRLEMREVVRVERPHELEGEQDWYRAPQPELER